MIKYLVPEARVIAHQIFHDDAALYPPDLDAEVDDRPSVGQDGRESEDPVFVTSAATHLFSPAWIEKEALALLEMIQKKAPTETTGNRNKVLLAGYGFGGIVAKKVLADSSDAVVDLHS